MQIVLIAAISLDGYIAKLGVPGTDFTSQADKTHFARSLAAYDVSIMGAETYRVARDFIRSRLTSARCRYVLTRTPAQFSADRASGQLEFTQLPPQALVSHLRIAGFQRCALLGGAQIHSLFLDARLVDRMIVSVEAKLFGGGTPFLARPTEATFTLESHERLPGSDTLVLTYRSQQRDDPSS